MDINVLKWAKVILCMLLYMFLACLGILFLADFLYLVAHKSVNVVNTLWNVNVTKTGAIVADLTVMSTLFFMSFKLMVMTDKLI